MKYICKMSHLSIWNITKLNELAEISYRILISLLNSSRPSKTCIFSVTFAVAFAFLILFVSLLYFNPCIYSTCYEIVKTEAIHDHLPNEFQPNGKYEMKKYSPKYIEPSVITTLNFLPEVNDIEFPDASEAEDLVNVGEISMLLKPAEGTSATEQEALTALQMALKMKASHKDKKARKLFQHALILQPFHPDVLNHYGEFLEENENNILKADHLYLRALTISPTHSRALVNRKRTLPVVKELDEQELERIDSKRIALIKMNPKDPALKRVKKEIYFQHIYHTVAIEGNTMTLAETRSVVETRMAVPGKSVMEHNQIIGLDAALRYINKTLVNKDGLITVLDILQIHRRVLGHSDPLEAGSFRQSQVFIGEHVPPHATCIADLMEQFVEWMQSENFLQLHPVEQAALAHYKLVYIHPFVDGNGRTARLLMNLILMRAGYPPVIIRKQDRFKYYKYLQLANEGDMRPFVRFIAHCTECTLDVFLFANEYGSECLKALESRHQEKSDIIPL